VSAAFWIRRFLAVFVIAFAIIGAAQLMKGHDAIYSMMHPGLWGLASALVFTIARYFQSRSGQQCAICKDTPETKS
jgi:heme A synthase